MELNMGRGKSGVNLLDRLLGRIVINSVTDCWIWQGGKNNIGYGMMRDGGKMRTTHRVSYEEHTQTKIPKNLIVMHSCDNPLCVNPAHLSLGTRKDNTRDMILKGRHRYWGKIDRRGIKRPTATCNRCGVVMAVNSIGRYHNDKCKLNPL